MSMEVGRSTKKEAGRKIRRTAAIGLSLVMASAVLSACSGGTADKPENRVLRIGMMYGSPDQEQWIRQQYTDTYEFTHQNIELQFEYAINYNDMRGQTGEQQPDPYEKFKELLTGKNPVDVVIADYSNLPRMTQDGLLKELDPLITKDKFDISDYVPTVIDGIKAVGDNKIYVLSPTFSSSALFYNKKIFQKAGVQPPTDNMTWQQVFDLARKVSGGEGADQIYGMTINRWGGSDLYSDVSTYVQPLQLKVFDDKAEKMLVDSGSSWSNAIKTILDLYKVKAIPNQEGYQKLSEALNKKYEKASKEGANNYNPFQGDLFGSGNIAMTVADYGYISQMKSNNSYSSQSKDFTPVDWDVVTPPVFEEKPGIGGSSYLSQPLGINNKAQNADDAWDFIKFLNSKEWAKLKSRSTYEIPARAEFIKPIDGMQYNIKAFYTLKPIPPDTSNAQDMYTKYPGLNEMYSISQQLFQEAATGKKTPEEVVKEWAVKGNALLKKVKANPKGTDEGGATTEGGAATEKEKVDAAAGNG
ncbi:MULTISPECIES: extracellular solute-binding protein [unclassified Paenibacillus]|uniref:extracellular solute-binding protein n=1 Tax=unclassified Paenibacillus TaxID=185978 RepID=UPI0009545D2E|nr:MULTISPECIES: extracellular solute-binding protein [unclassified Paenibacillus]SIQ19128.1 multiple sugar transport system substrate-binding protein [Paenibacillus sp. RU4X]SIQ40744.1 multiple sugar transport system substrate-binding protein [Paenibacillus sp. RU4T]